MAIVLGALALYALTGLPTAASAPPVWGEPVPIAPDFPTAWFPDIQADPTGTVRMVWEGALRREYESLPDNLLPSTVVISQLGASGWSNPTDILVVLEGQAARATVMSDGTWVHVVSRKEREGSHTRLMYMRAPATADLSNAHSWSEPRALSDTNAYYSSLIGLPGRGLLVIYNQMTDAPTQQAPGERSHLEMANEEFAPSTSASARSRMALFARRSLDDGATWGPPVRISNTSVPVSRNALAVSPDASLLVAAWDEGYDNQTGQGKPIGIGTAVSTDGGATWSSAQPIRSATGPTEQASVAIGRDGPVLVYRSSVSQQIFYRTSADGGLTWSDEQPIPDVVARPYPGTHNFDRLATAVDSDGRVILAYVGDDPSAPNGLSVMVTTFLDGVWSPPERVAAPQGFPEAPRLTVALGNQVHLTYFLRDRQFDQGHYTIWWVQGRSDAPGIAPAQVEPAPAPTPAPTPVVEANLPPPVVIPTPAVPSGLGMSNLERPQSIVSHPLQEALSATALALLALLVGMRLIVFLRRIRV